MKNFLNYFLKKTHLNHSALNTETEKFTKNNLTRISLLDIQLITIIKYNLTCGDECYRLSLRRSNARYHAARESISLLLLLFQRRISRALRCALPLLALTISWEALTARSLERATSTDSRRAERRDEPRGAKRRDETRRDVRDARASTRPEDAFVTPSTSYAIYAPPTAPSAMKIRWHSRKTLHPIRYYKTVLLYFYIERK